MVSARILIVRSEMPTWPWGQLEGWTPLTPQCFSPIPGLPRGQRGTPDFSFLAFSAVLRLYQGFMYVRPVLYTSYIPSPCKTCSFSKNINKIMIYMCV